MAAKAPPAIRSGILRLLNCWPRLLVLAAFLSLAAVLASSAAALSSSAAVFASRAVVLISSVAEVRSKLLVAAATEAVSVSIAPASSPVASTEACMLSEMVSLSWTIWSLSVPRAAVICSRTGVKASTSCAEYSSVSPMGHLAKQKKRLPARRQESAGSFRYVAEMNRRQRAEQGYAAIFSVRTDRVGALPAGWCWSRLCQRGCVYGSYP